MCFLMYLSIVSYWKGQISEFCYLLKNVLRQNEPQKAKQVIYLIIITKNSKEAKQFLRTFRKIDNIGLKTIRPNGSLSRSLFNLKYFKKF